MDVITIQSMAAVPSLPSSHILLLSAAICWFVATRGANDRSVRDTAGDKDCKNNAVYLSEGPQNITRSEGEKDILIPCVVQNMPKGIYPIWEVNGRIYDITRLPNVYQPMSNGLKVTLITISMNQTSYRCFYPAKETASFILQASSVGVLIVADSNRGNGSNVLSKLHATANGPQISIDHQTLFFGNDTRVLAWKVLQSNAGCDHFEVEAKRNCADPTSVTHTWIVHDRNKVSIPTSDTVTETAEGKVLASFNITRRSMEGTIICQDTVTDIQVNESTITKDLVVSHAPIVFNISTQYTTYAAFPVHQADLQDCLCPIILLKVDTCYDLEQCHCASDAAILNSAGQVKVCHSSLTGKLSLHIQNVTRMPKFNNTRLHFYNTFVCRNGSFMRVYRLYADSFQVHQIAPELPKINVTQTNGEYAVCIMDSDMEYTDSYEFNIQDVTGETTYQVLVANFDESGDYCTFLPSLINSNSTCSPFIVSVEANNPFTTMSQNFSITQPNKPTTITSMCQCLNDSVQVDIWLNISKINSFLTNNYTLQVSGMCNNKYLSNVNLEMKIRPINRSKIIMCSENFIEFNQLDCTNKSWAYVTVIVDIFWVPHNESLGVKCLLATSESSYLITCSTDNNDVAVLSITVILTSCIVMTMSLFTILVLLYYKICRIKSKVQCHNSKVESINYDSI